MKVSERERGETLVELLVALVILSIAVIVIVEGMMAAVKMSHLHRLQATADAALRNWAENLSNVTDSGYQPCQVSAMAAATAPSTTSVLTPGTSSPQWWDSTSSPGSWSSIGCTTATDSGVQKVTLQMTITDSQFGQTFTRSLDASVRKPCSSATC